MKTFVALLIGCLLSFFAQAQENTDAAKIEFSETSHNFRDIKQGAVVEWTFKFKNTGNVPLVLTNVATTCGCTAPEWPREPISPNAMGEIKIRFNSSGKSGMQNKVISIYSNASNNPEHITISGNVIP